MESQHLKRKIRAIRMQPIIDLGTGQVVAREVLVSVLNEKPESFFKHLTNSDFMSIFTWQLSAVRNLEGDFWLNMPCDIFINQRYYAMLQYIAPAHNVTIEIQDPENLFSLSEAEIHRFRQHTQAMIKSGWNIVLDDFTYDMLPAYACFDLQFSGVKIDRSQKKNPKNLIKIVHALKTRSEKMIVTFEGIESSVDLLLANQAGADYGQGFLWQEITVNL